MAEQLEITRETEPARLLVTYARQNKPQDCYLFLDCETGQFGADYNGEIGNAVPASVWHGHTRRYTIPALQMETANALLDELAPLAQRILDGYESVYNGNNYVATFTVDAQQAEDEIERTLNGMEGDLYWNDASDWLHAIKAELIDRIRAGATVEELEDEYAGNGTEDEPILEGLRPYLEGLVKDAAEEEAVS